MCVKTAEPEAIFILSTMFFLILISIIFWSVFGVLFLLKLPVVLAGLFLPFAIYCAFQMVYPEKRNRIYLSVTKDQGSRGQVP